MEEPARPHFLGATLMFELPRVFPHSRFFLSFNYIYTSRKVFFRPIYTIENNTPYDSNQYTVRCKSIHRTIQIDTPYDANQNTVRCKFFVGIKNKKG